MAQIRKKVSPQYQHGCPHENVDKSLELVRIDFLADGSDGADRGIVALQLFFDFLHAVHDGGMVPAAHDVADLFQSGVIFLAEVHGNLTGISDIGGAFVAVDIGGRNMEMLRYDLDNQLRSYLPCVVKVQIYSLCRCVYRNFQMLFINFIKTLR